MEYAERTLGRRLFWRESCCVWKHDVRVRWGARGLQVLELGYYWLWMGPTDVLDRRVDQAQLLSYDEEPRVCFCRRGRACIAASQGLQVAVILATVQLIFGGYVIVVEMAMSDHADAFVFSLYRDVGASIVLLVACTLLGQHKTTAGDRLLFVGAGRITHCIYIAHTVVPVCIRAHRIHGVSTARLSLLGVGLSGITITQTALVLALQWVPAFNASLMQPSQPVLTLLLALCLRLESLRLRSVAGALKLAGILIGCAGATSMLKALSWQPHSSLPPGPVSWA